MNDILRNHNSMVNQEIKGKLIDREIYCCFTCEMDTMLSKGYEDSDFPSYEEIENYWSYPEYTGNYYYFGGGSEEEKDSILEGIQDRIDTFQAMAEDYKDHPDLKNRDKEIKYFSIVEDLQEDYDGIAELETEPAEIFEWYAVTTWFAEKLRNQGECILDYGTHSYWGRQCTGQAIVLDYVIAEIAYDMGILDGQENSWAR